MDLRRARTHLLEEGGEHDNLRDIGDSCGVLTRIGHVGMPALDGWGRCLLGP